MARPRKETQHLDADKRPSRIPIDGPRNLLEIPDQDPAYHYTWQPEGELSRFLRAGYEWVIDPGVPVGDPTVNKSNRFGAPGNILVFSYKTTPLYALRIRQEWYDEDMDMAENKRLEQEAAMQPDAAQGEYGKVTIDYKLGSKDQR